MKSLTKASTLLAVGILTSQLFAVSANAALPDSCAKDAKGTIAKSLMFHVKL
jgi:hypothetical protein